jgi:hypothetical protein
LAGDDEKTTVGIGFSSAGGGALFAAPPAVTMLRAKMKN